MKERGKGFLKDIWKLITKPEMLVLPGQLAYFFLLAIVPTITLIAYGAAVFHLSFDFLSNFILKAFGNEVSSLIIPIVSNININSQFFFTLMIGFYAASTGAASIIITSNEMYGIQNSSFLHRKVKAIFMTFILVLLLLFLLVVPIFGTHIVNILEYVNLHPNVTRTIAFSVQLLKGPISWFIIFFLIKILYTMAPDKRILSKTNTYGAIFTTFGIFLSTMLYSFYVNHFAHYANVYGGLAQFVILMVWLYLIAYIFTIGIAINAQQLEKIGDIKIE
ncbi:MAG: YihY/virulence factor BrkB family protein [Bacilli bacterium]|jgi:membrane protein|nr:YihY/virulence factor BrkB family protein [Bacilli bacterium]